MIGRHVSDEIMLERLLPYMLYLVNDSLPQVRAQALRTITHCLQLIASIPRSDANIFPEYILPSLAWLTQDTEVIVRIAYAENIASLAETALKFLEMAQLDYGIADQDEKEDAPIQYQVRLLRNCLVYYFSLFEFVQFLLFLSISTFMQKEFAVRAISRHDLNKLGLQLICRMFWDFLYNGTPPFTRLGHPKHIKIVHKFQVTVTLCKLGTLLRRSVDTRDFVLELHDVTPFEVN